jgi:CDGSH-type Zn-finger protein
VSEARSFDHPDEIVCPGGPLLVRGDRVVEDPDGVAHRTTRPVSAVCRCGHSGGLPWCDGTHKVLPPGSRP